eukprot:scaffold6333_cov125-Isochrysis_galbana.AAC.3
MAYTDARTGMGTGPPRPAQTADGRRGYDRQDGRSAQTVWQTQTVWVWVYRERVIKKNCKT